MFDGLRSIRGVLDAWTEDREDDADGRGEWQFGGGRTTIGERYGEVEASCGSMSGPLGRVLEVLLPPSGA